MKKSLIITNKAIAADYKFTKSTIFASSSNILNRVFDYTEEWRDRALRNSGNL